MIIEKKSIQFLEIKENYFYLVPKAKHPRTSQSNQFVCFKCKQIKNTKSNFIELIPQKPENSGIPLGKKTYFTKLESFSQEKNILKKVKISNTTLEKSKEIKRNFEIDKTPKHSLNQTNKKKIAKYLLSKRVNTVNKITSTKCQMGDIDYWTSASFSWNTQVDNLLKNTFKFSSFKKNQVIYLKTIKVSN